MSGLLVKDFRLLLQRKQAVIMMLVIAVFISFSIGEEFILGYLTFIGLILATSSISYDEFDNGYPFLMTLPITNKTYVLEKYVLSAGAMLFSWLVALVISFATKMMHGAPIQPAEDLLGAVLILFFPCLLMNIMIPIQLKFGSEKSRIVLLAIGGIGAIIGYGAAGFMEKIGVDVDDIIQTLDRITPATAFLLLTVLVIATLFISYRISNVIMDRKIL